MRILLASSEVHPFAKTGGLADVACALPKALYELGADIRVVMPRYKMIDESKFHLTPIMPELKVHFGDKVYNGTVLRSTFPNTEIPVYFIQNDYFFSRNELYTENGKDYPDNALRFAFYSLATLWMLKGLDWQPDIIHCNDWQTAYIPIYLRNMSLLKQDPFYQSIKVLYTIHNLGYQGTFDKEWLTRVGLHWGLFTLNGVEFFGRMNLMKGGILFSDAITTVSKNYAREMQTTEFGNGLDGVLRTRADRLFGILNGIDTQEWTPQNDPYIPQKFDTRSLEKKAINKELLQKQSKLPIRPDVPVIGMISRLAAQKGFDLLVKILDTMLQDNVQLILLGTGQPEYHEFFSALAKKYPQKIAAHLTFNNNLAHLIEAGSDMFLMPSYYEPCGLNQLYSMQYGTVPIVRKTGGLADTVLNATPTTINSGTATGFVFTDYTDKALLKTVQKACELYLKEPKLWRQLQLNGMKKDFSWNKSGRDYFLLYNKIISGKIS